MNQLGICVVGNLTDEPELRFTSEGIAVARFSVAHNPQTYNRREEKWVDGEPTFWQCSAWRFLAENVVASLHAGTRVVMFGNQRTRRWESDGRGRTPQGQMITSLQLDVIAIGPDLGFATVPQIVKATKSARGEIAPDDPWASASKERPAASTTAGSSSTGGARPAARQSAFDDEPPF